jgi:hypothetical protein
LQLDSLLLCVCGISDALRLLLRAQYAELLAVLIGDEPAHREINM